MTKLEGKVKGEEQYMGQPMKTFEGTFSFPSNDEEFQGGKYLGKEFPVKVELAIHPNNSKRIIVNIPGIGGDIDGYADKYKNLARHMQENDLGAVVRTHGHGIAGYLPDLLPRAALQYIRENAFSICGEPEPDVFLMGFSAGASAVAGIASEYPEVKGILLYAPSGDMPEKKIKDSLKKFKGEVYVVQGEDDEIVGPEAGRTFHRLATGAKHKELFMIPDCSHQFIGEANGRIMSEAPFYAFAEKPTDKPVFPDPKGGIKLYD
jgi:pimeloyl-ACP methyl ester carboxylesterase